METLVPWSRLESLIEPFYPKKGNGRPPMPLGTMLRIHFMQQWFGYSGTKKGVIHLLVSSILFMFIFYKLKNK